MDILATVIASASLLVCLSTMLFACSVCRRIFKRKEEKDLKKDEENTNGLDEKKENGISNPAYQPALASKQEDETKSGCDITNTAKQELTNGNGCNNKQALREKNNEPINNSSESFDEKPIDSSCISRDANGESTRDEKLKTLHANQDKEHSDTKESESFPETSHNEATLSSLKSPAEKRLVTASVSTELTTSSMFCGTQNENNESTLEHSHDEKQVSLNIMSYEDMKPEWEKYDGITIKGGWRQDVKVTDLLRFGLIENQSAAKLALEHENNSDILKPLKLYMEGENPIAGVLVTDTGEKKSIFKSAKEGILRRGTAISLLEAQAATGSVIDPYDGRKMSVNEGYQLGLLDKVYETVLSRAERAVTGYKSRITNESIPLGQAMERGLVIESHGMRLLEAQLATGGIIDHRVNLKLPIELAIKRRLLSEKAAKKLSATCNDVDDEEKPDDLKTFFDPNTEENVTYAELMRRSVVDNDTGMRLYPLEKVGRKRYSYNSSFSGRSSLVSSRSGSTEDIATAVTSYN